MTASTSLSLDDYDAIAAAVMETERGRWFLAEYARRNRVADTAAVLEALSAFEARLSERLAPRPAETVAPSSAVAARLEAAANQSARMREALTAMPKQGRHVVRALRRCDELERSLELALAAAGAPRPARLASPPDTIESLETHEASDTDRDAPETAHVQENVQEDVREAVREAQNDLQEPAPPAKINAIHALDDIYAASLAAELFAPELLATERLPADRDDAPAHGAAHVNGFARREPSVREAPLALAAAAERSNDAPEPLVLARVNGSEPHDPGLDSGPPDVTPVIQERPAERSATAEPPASPPPTLLRPALPKAWTPGLLETLSAEERAILFA